MGLIIHAPNVHQGGGRTLLNALLTCADQSTCCVVDERMPTNKIDPGVVICSIKPTLIDRFKAEVLLAKNAKFGIICPSFWILIWPNNAAYTIALIQVFPLLGQLANQTIFFDITALSLEIF